MSLAFPNVPQLPGAPQVVRSASEAITVVSIASAAIQNVLAAASQTPNIWGVFENVTTTDDDGNESQQMVPVLSPDSIREFGTGGEWRLSNYPIQRGSFTSYNKVILPAEYSVRMVKGGSVSDRQNFQASVLAVAASLDLYSIVTPEQTFTNCNVTRYQITRKGVEDAFFIEVDLFFQQINEIQAQYSTTQTTDTSNAASPTAIPSASEGTVTPPPQVSPLVASPLSSVGIQ